MKRRLRTTARAAGRSVADAALRAGRGASSLLAPRRLLRRLAAVGALAGAAAFGAAFWDFLARSDYFTVREVDLRTPLRDGARAPVDAADFDGANLFSGLREVEDRLAARPDLAGVEVRRVWPDRVEVAWEPRATAALLAHSGGVLALSDSGAVLRPATSAEVRDPRLVLLTGWGAEPLKPGDRVDAEEWRRAFVAMRAWDHGRSATSPQLSEVHRTAPGELELVFANESRAALGAGDPAPLLAAYTAALDALGPRALTGRRLELLNDEHLSITPLFPESPARAAKPRAPATNIVRTEARP
ncbi:MAG: hypothetical protein SF028_07115 [Candidatus Sumerlaeia bacterium]|nr:hypothetical protein [Candidatus Sumerlaeia bacterium]